MCHTVKWKVAAAAAVSIDSTVAAVGRLGRRSANNGLKWTTVLETGRIGSAV